MLQVSSFPSPTRRRGERGEEEKEGRGGPRPKPLVQFGLGLGGARATSWLLPTKAHYGPILFPVFP